IGTSIVTSAYCDSVCRMLAPQISSWNVSAAICFATNAPGSWTKNGVTNAATTPATTSAYRFQSPPRTATYRTTGGSTRSANCLNAMAQPKNTADRTNATADDRPSWS